MATSFPTRRFGSAQGISAPCRTPRPKPAGPGLWLDKRVKKLVTQPMTAAAAKRESMRNRILRVRLRDGTTLACASSMFFVEQEHVFETAHAASRIFRRAGPPVGRDGVWV